MLTKQSVLEKSTNRLVDFLRHSFLLHFFLAYLVFQNIDYFIPTVVDEKAQLSTIEFNREAYRQSMRDSVNNIQKVHDLLQKMEQVNLDNNKQKAEESVEKSSIDDMAIPELYELSEHVLDDIMRMKEAEVERKLTTMDRDKAANEKEKHLATEQAEEKTQKEPLSEEEMLVKMQDNQTIAYDVLSQFQKNQQGEGINLSGENQGKGKSENKQPSLSGQGHLSSEIDTLLTQQKSSQYIAKNAKGGKQKDFTQAMSDVYGDSEQYRFDHIAATQEKKPPQAPSINMPETRMATNKLSSNAASSAKWLMLDSWYVIGPFDNTNRQHIETAFPPEKTIDFDAKYLGKNKRVLTWKYQLFDRYPIIPVGMQEYEIYYAYTQLKAEKAQDIWLAVGSDDQSKLWINNLLIWNSVPQHKGWQISEGFRKVRLKSGINNVLFRLENGQYSGGFSVAMSSGE